jgi:hypothetical protein
VLCAVACLVYLVACLSACICLPSRCLWQCCCWMCPRLDDQLPISAALPFMWLPQHRSPPACSACKRRRVAWGKTTWASCGSCCACGRPATTRCWSGGPGRPSGHTSCRLPRCVPARERWHACMQPCSHAASQPLYCPAPAGRRAQSILQPALVCQQHSHPIPHDAPIVPLSSLPASQLQLAAAKRLSAARRASLAEALRPSRLTICATCKDVPEDPVVSICGHVYCSQCVGSEISKAGRGSAGERPRCEGAAGWAGWACPSSGVMKRHIEAHKCILSFPLVSPSSACLPDRARFDQLQKLSWHSTASLVTIRWASTTP